MAKKESRHTGALHDPDIRYIVAVEAIVYHEGRYLMIVRSEMDSHAPGTLTFPAGKVEAMTPEPGTLELALQREVREEACVEIDPAPVYLGSKMFTADDGKPVVMVDFLCRYAGGVPAVGDPVEVSAVGWMTAEEALRDPRTPPWTRETLALAEKARLSMG